MRKLAPLCALLALACGASGPPAAPAPANLPPDLGTRKSGTDWPRFLGPTGDSVSSEKGFKPWPKDGPRIVYALRPQEGYCTPVVSRGRLFVFDRLRNQARLRCFKSETGEPLWTFDYETHYRDQYNYSGGPRCCPVVDGDRVYIYGPEGMLHCVRAVDGKPVWKVDTIADFGVIQNFFGVGSTPVVEGGLLLTVVGGSPPDSDKIDNFRDLKGNGSAIVAFDKHTGKVRYKVGDELACYASPVLATIGERRWCFVFARGGLIGMDPANGKIDFHFPWRADTLECVNASNPVVVGNRVFISETYGPGAALLEVRPGGYKVLWSDARKGRDKSMQCHWNTPIYVDGYLYGCSGRHASNAELRCIELATGKVMWRERNLSRTSLLRIEDYLVCLGEDGILHLLKINPKKYEEIMTLELRPRGSDGKPDAQADPLLVEPCWAAPILSHGLMYVRGKGRLVCLEVIPERK